MVDDYDEFQMTIVIEMVVVVGSSFLKTKSWWRTRETSTTRPTEEEGWEFSASLKRMSFGLTSSTSVTVSLLKNYCAVLVWYICYNINRFNNSDKLNRTIIDD